jgi:hypothetical protein
VKPTEHIKRNVSIAVLWLFDNWNIAVWFTVIAAILYGIIKVTLEG